MEVVSFSPMQLFIYIHTLGCFTHRVPEFILHKAAGSQNRMRLLLFPKKKKKKKNRCQKRNRWREPYKGQNVRWVLKNQTWAQLEVITLEGCRKKGDGNKKPAPPTVSKKMLAAAASGRQNLQKTSRTIAVFVETSAVPVQNMPLWGITEENHCWPFFCFISHCSALLHHSVPCFVYVCFPKLHQLRHCRSSSCVKCEVDRMLIPTFPVSYKCVEKPS